LDLTALDEFKKVEVKLQVTHNQHKYIKAMRRSAITFCSGPAGCGKTYLAVAEALRALLSQGRPDKRTQKILLLRPAITAGESVGFLPGTLEEKTSFYMRPFHSAGIKLLGEEMWLSLVRTGLIEFETMSFIRGVTWENTFVLIDEAQNCSPKQMEMLLTRLGKNGKIVVAGDHKQSDLDNENGLQDAMLRLKCREIGGLSFCHLTGDDNMRHPIVKAIAEAYTESLEPITYYAQAE
jgi:phosphate starvation-inducible PhoH-like protein